GLAQRFARDVALRGEDLARIVLHPARLRKDLAELALADGHRAAGLVEQDRPRAGGALIEGQNVLHRKNSSRGLLESAAYVPAGHRGRARAPPYAPRPLRGLQARRRAL